MIILLMISKPQAGEDDSWEVAWFSTELAAGGERKRKWREKEEKKRQYLMVGNWNICSFHLREEPYIEFAKFDLRVTHQLQSWNQRYKYQTKKIQARFLWG